MALNVKNISDVIGRDVFTADGEYYGQIADVKVDLEKFRVQSLVVEAGRGTKLASAVGSKKGVIIPYQMVQSVGDIVLVRQVTNALPQESETEDVEATPALPF